MEQVQEDHIIMFPFMAQGHLIPFLALALHMEQRTSYKITIVNTPLNIKNLHSSLPPNSSINLVDLPFCSTDHGLPPHSESTDVLPYHLSGRLLEATQSLKPSFNQLIKDITQQQEGQPPRCIISDMFLGWTVDVAHELNIFHSIYFTSNAYSMAIYHSLWTQLPHNKTVSDEFSLPDFPEVSTLHRSQLSGALNNADGTDYLSVVIQTVVSFWWKSDGHLISTIEELDQTGLKYFRARMGDRPIWTVLPTLYDSMKARPRDNLEECLQWLDTKPPSSVLYVSFGSQNTISMKQMVELALGLEASGKNFIWVVQPPVGFDINEEFRSEWLPEGFVGRIKEGNRGLIVYKWAPQLEILSHKSTCGFLSHCGWNSTLESLSNGVPIIGWPLSAEQFYNSKMLEEELGVCVEVARGNSVTSEIKHEEIARVIGLVMGGTLKAEEMKKKACEVKNMMANATREDEGVEGSLLKAMDDFIATVASDSDERVYWNKQFKFKVETI